MSSAAGVRRPLLAYRQGSLEMDGVRLEELAALYGTPFFVFSESRLAANYQALRAGMAAAGAEPTLRYCAKANNEAGVLRVLAQTGSSVLASHAAEVELALACGFPPDRIAYQRPGAPAAELATVLDAGVGLLHLFRPGDLDTLGQLARRHGRTVRLSLRLRHPGRPWSSPLAALNSRLGLAPAEAAAVARTCRGDERLRVAALNVYVGTQRLGTTAFERAFAGAFAVAGRVIAEQRAPLAEINLGGGIPSPSLRKLTPFTLWSRWRDRRPGGGDADGAADDDSSRKLERFGYRLATAYREAAAAAGLLPTPTLAAEPGRSLVGNAGLLVSRVVASVDGWLFLDASRNVLGESPLLFQRQILPLRERGEARSSFVHLSGSTLNTMDVLDLRRRLPALEVGDTIAFCDAGAYSISRASRYAGMAPIVLLIGRQGEVRTIRRREGLADLAGPMAPALPAGSPVDVG